MQQASAFLYLVILFTYTDPVHPRSVPVPTCSTRCTGDASKFAYRVGQSYEYEYKAEVHTGVTGDNKEQTGINLQADVVLQPMTSCEFIMQIKNAVQLTNTNGQGELIDVEALEEAPLLFSWQDGRVEEVCPTMEEDPWVLNVKRGVLATLQNSMQNMESKHTVMEVDTSGECETEYEVEVGWRSTSVKKVKYLDRCSSQVHIPSVHDVPILNTEHRCEQIIKDNIITSSICQEIHALKQFSEQKYGATTTSKQTLQLKAQGESANIYADAITRQTTMVFENKNLKNVYGAEEETVRLLDLLEYESRQEVNEEVANTYSMLVSVMKQLNQQQLRSAYEQIQERPRQRKFFLDALPMMSTGAGIHMMKHVIEEGLISETATDVWMTSLGLMTNPTNEALEAAVELLEGSVPRKQAILGVSALANQFCKSHSECQTSPAIKQLISRMQSFLGSSCRKNDDVDIVVVLKALGNVGQYVFIQETLKRCYMETENDIATRLAAIQALNRMPCDRQPYNLMHVFANPQEDVELRIAAYETVVKCGHSLVALEVQSMLEAEPVNQVGSFIWRHLWNLPESMSPELKRIIDSESLQEKYDSKALKMSRNDKMEWENGKVQTNVIYTPTSFLPKSLSMNFTVDLFGEAINLFEVGGRIEGLEELADIFFGPNGYFPQEYIEEFLKILKNRKEGKYNEMDSFSTVFGKIPKVEHEPSLAAYMKVLGNDLAYGNLLDVNNWMDVDFGLRFEDLVRFMRGEEIDYTKTFQLANIQTTIPLSSGLPLHLSLNGSALVRVLAQGNVDFKHFNDFEISGHIKPSAVVDLRGEMSLGGRRGKTGIVYTSTLHTNTDIDATIVKRGQKLFIAKLNIPQDKLQILDVSNSIFNLNNGQLEEIEGEGLGEEEECSEVPLIGMEMCMTTAYMESPSSYPTNPFYGPFRTSIYLKKTDTFNQYLFEYRWEDLQENVQGVQGLSILLDTPGSQVDRRHQLLYTLDTVRGTMDIDLHTPYKQVAIKGDYSWSPLMKKADLSMSVDGVEWLGVGGSLKALSKDRVTRYRPKVTVRSILGELLSVTGSLGVIQPGKFSFDITVKGLTENPIFMQGNMKSNDEVSSGSLSIDSTAIQTDVRAKIGSREDMRYMNLFVDYTLPQSETQKLMLSAKHSVSQQASLKKTSWSMDIATTVAPEWNVKADMELTSSPGYCETGIDLTFGETKWAFSSIWSDQVLEEIRNTVLTLKLNSPRNDVNYMLDFHREKSPEKQSTKLKLRTSSSWEMKCSSVIDAQSSPLNYSLYAGISYPGRDSSVLLRLHEPTPRKLMLETSLKLQPTWLIRSTTTLDDRTTEQAYDLKASSIISLPEGVSHSLEGDFYHSDETAGANIKVAYMNDREYSAGFHSNDESVVLSASTPEDNYGMRVKWENTEIKKSLTIDVEAGYTGTFISELRQTQDETHGNIEMSYWNKSDPRTTLSLRGRSSDSSTTALFSWDVGKTLELSVKHEIRDLPAFHISGLLKTPFEGYEAFGMDVLYDQTPISINAQVKGNGAEETFDIRLKAQHEDESSKLYLETKTTIWPSIDGAFIKIDSTRLINEAMLEVRAKYDENEGKIKFEAKGSEDGRRQEGKMTITTQIPFIESVSSSIVAEIDESGIDVQVHGDWNKQVFQLSGSCTINPNDIEIVTNFRSSFSHDKKLNIKITKQNSSITIRALTSWSPDSFASLLLEGTLRNDHDLHGKISVSLSGQTIEALATYTLTNNNINILLEGASSGKIVKVELKGILFNTDTEHTLEGSLDIQLPWIPQTGFTFSAMKSDKQLQGNIVTRQDGESAIMTYGFDAVDNVNWNSNFKIMFPSDEFEMQLSGTWNDRFQANIMHNGVQVAHSLLYISDEKIEYTRIQSAHFQLDTALTSELTADFIYETTDDRFKPSLIIKTRKEDHETISVKGQVFHKENNIVGELNVKLPNTEEYSISAGYERKPEVHEYRLRVLKGQLKLFEFLKKSESDKYTAAISVYQTELYLSYSRTWNTKHFEGLVKYGQDITSFSGDIKMTNQNNYKAFAELKHNTVKLYDINMGYMIDGDKADGSIIIQNENKEEYKLEASMEKKEYAGKATVDIRTPVNGFYHLQAAANFEATFENVEFFGTLKKEDNTISVRGNLEYVRTNTQITAKMTFILPNYPRIDVTASTDFSQPQKVATFMMSGFTNGEQLDASFSLLAGDENGALILDVTTPFKAFKSGNFKIEYEGNEINKKASISGRFNDAETKIATTCQFSGYKKHVSVSFQTPLTQMKSAQLSATLDLSESEKQIHMRLGLNEVENRVSMSLHLTEPWRGSIDTDIFLPVFSIPSIQLRGQYELGTASFIRMNVQTEELVVFAIESTGSFTLTTTKVSTHIVAPSVSLDIKTSFEFDLQPERGYFTSKSKLIIDDEGYMSGELTLSNAQLHIYLSTPLQQYRQVQLSIGEGNDTLTRSWFASFQVNGLRTMYVSTQLNNDLTGASFELISPYRNYEHLSLSAGIRQKRELHFEAVNGDDLIEFTGTVEREGGSGTIELRLTTPYEGYENVDWKIEYNFEGAHRYVHMTGNENGVDKDISLVIENDSVLLSFQNVFPEYRRVVFKAERETSSNGAVYAMDFEAGRHFYEAKLGYSFATLESHIEAGLTKGRNNKPVYDFKFNYDVRNPGDLSAELAVAYHGHELVGLSFTGNVSPVASSLKFRQAEHLLFRRPTEHTVTFEHDFSSWVATIQLKLTDVARKKEISLLWSSGPDTNDAKLLTGKLFGDFVFSSKFKAENGEFHVDAYFTHTDHQHGGRVFRVDVAVVHHMDTDTGDVTVTEDGHVLLVEYDLRARPKTVTFKLDGELMAEVTVQGGWDKGELMFLSSNTDLRVFVDWNKSSKTEINVVGKRVSDDQLFSQVQMVYDATSLVIIRNSELLQQTNNLNVNWSEFGAPKPYFDLEYKATSLEEEVVSLAVNAHKDEQRYEWSFDLEQGMYSNDVRIKYQGYLDLNPGQISGAHEATVKYEGDEIEVKESFEYQKYSLETKVNGELVVSHKYHLQTSPDGDVDFVYSYKNHPTDDEWLLEFHRKNVNGDISGSMKAAVQFYHETLFHLEGEWQRSNHNFQNELHLFLNGFEEVTFKSELSLRKHISGEFSASYGDKHISGTVEVMKKRKHGKVNVTLNTPFMEDPVVAEVDYSAKKNLSIKVDVTAGEHQIHATLATKRRSFNLHFESSFTEELNVDGEFHNRAGEFSTVGSGAYGDNKLQMRFSINNPPDEPTFSINGEATFNHENLIAIDFKAKSEEFDKEVSLIVHTPLEDLELIRVEMNLKTDIDNLEAKAKLEVILPTFNFKIDGAASWNHPTYGGHLRVSGSEIDDLSAEFTLVLDETNDKYGFVAELSCPRNTLHFEAHKNYYLYEIDALVHYFDFEAKFTLKLDISTDHAEVHAQLEDTKVHFTLDGYYPGIGVYFKLENPHTWFREVIFESTHSYSETEHSHKYSLHVGPKSYLFKQSHKPDEGEFYQELDFPTTTIKRLIKYESRDGMKHLIHAQLQVIKKESGDVAYMDTTAEDGVFTMTMTANMLTYLEEMKMVVSTLYHMARDMMPY